MFEISTWEIMLVVVIALFVIGPKQLPEIAHKLGKWLRYLRNLVAGARQELAQQANAEVAEVKERQVKNKTDEI